MKALKLLAVSALSLIAISANAQLLRTTVAQGEVEGVEQNGLAHYKGIPFATPPVGELRWKAPRPAEKWNGVYKADSFKAKPYQGNGDQGGNNGGGQRPQGQQGQRPQGAPQGGPQGQRPQGQSPQGAMPQRPQNPGVSEDCLYLNVLTPAKKANEGLPVLVWIHGGGFNTGGSMEQNGENFAKNGIVYVAITYRTNCFGFLSLPELSAESQKETGRAISGNYGLMDQIMALQWVHDNIAAFGGDPAKVTIMGESAGAISVAMLCQSPLAKGLFRGAISESGGNMVPEDNVRIDNNSLRNVKGSEKYGKDYMERIGFGKMTLEELRAQDPAKFMGDPIAFGDGGALWPCYDNYVLSSDAYVQYLNGNYNDVNVMIGTNSDEGSMFTGFKGGWTPALYEQEMTTSFPNAQWQAKMRAMYPCSNDEEAFNAHSDIFREAAFAWPTYAWANIQSQKTESGSGKGNVYMFFFDHAKQNMFRRTNTTGRTYLTMHAGEMGLTFGNAGGGFGGAADPTLTKTVFSYWVNFIKTGNPNGSELPTWPVYKKDTKCVMEFRDGAKVIDLPNKPQLELWEEYMNWRRENKTPLN